MGAPTGSIRCVAAGAGGTSGDGGDGGRGGANNATGPGEDGSRGASGTGGTTNAQGGGHQQSGVGGTSSRGNNWDGARGQDTKMGLGGQGGSTGAANVHGGGGGGGGWYPGGGGNAGAVGAVPGGGGGGGSSYLGNMISAISSRGGGTTGNGQVVLNWDTPPPQGFPPPPPTDVSINNIPLENETTTKIPAGGSGTITAHINNPDPTELNTLVIRVSRTWDFSTYATFIAEQPLTPTVDWHYPIVLTGLEPAALYYVRLWSLDSHGMYSGSINSTTGVYQEAYTQGSFWTNRPPDPPTLTFPAENTQYLPTDNITFTWTTQDPDEEDPQSAYQFRYRRAPRPNLPQERWVESGLIDSVTTSHAVDAGAFRGNTFYLWSVRTRDSVGMWSAWSLPNSFFVIADSEPPTLLYPVNGDAVVADQVNVFRWEFNDPSPTAAQHTGDVRFRVVGTENWVNLYGEPDPGMPGSNQDYLIPRGSFIEGYHYEWQARTTNADLFVSDWSESKDFWAIATPGQGAYDVPSPEYTSIAPALGCGVNRVFVFDRGGEVMRGEITGIAQLRYNRKRDDISGCTVFTDGKDCTGLLRMLRTWQYELVVFRDGQRVWEGPIIRIDAKPADVEIEASDVMRYVYRRVMRQGYSDAYREVNGVEQGGLSVVTRARLITMNCLSYDDPNVLRWLTTVDHADDARQHRSVPDYSKTAWQEIDDLAAHAGLDYTVVGRRIVYNDTHRPLGRLPEMRDTDFTEPVHVTEYGMQLANHFGVTNNDGIYGVAQRGIDHNPDGTETPLYYGWVEQLASPYGEQEAAVPEALSPAARESLINTLTQQADRNIANRWPAPLVVRVPDNAQISPNANITIHQLVPGVWVPVRAQGTIREVAQWQKLDSVEVLVEGGNAEKITCVMSPAPNAGEDPDAGQAAEAAV
jgi:hypothetical protein